MKLDDVLSFLNTHEANRTIRSYYEYKSQALKYSVCVGLFQTLINLDLITTKHDVSQGGETFIINLKGRELLQKGQSTKDIHNDLKKRESLEIKILEGTIESYRTGKTATNLNKIQLIVTSILGIVSALTILFQCESNKISKRNLEVLEKAYQLELKNKALIDTIVVKLNSPLKN